MKFHLVGTSHIFVDATHVKACANSKKMRKQTALGQTLWYEEELKKEIAQDRKRHGKKPLKDRNPKDPPASDTGAEDLSIKESAQGEKTRKCSVTDPERSLCRHCRF